MADNNQDVALHRILMAAVGALAGISAWFFFEIAAEVIKNPRLFLLSITAVMSFFALLLGLVGPLNWPRALLGAAALAVIAAFLLFWASFRFDDLDAFFDSPLTFCAFGLLLFIGAPFVSAGLSKPGGARDYALLFDTAWAILVRYIAGWLFVAVVWGIVFLSNALLELVGVTVIERVLDIEPVPFALTGLFLGLALAIMHELREYVSPFLVLRLFRILLPVIAVVVAVFLIALPLRGLGSLFGDFSVAVTLMAVAIAAITLITSALDRTSSEEVQATVMRVSARGMAVLLIPLCLAAGWAIWLRIDAYGWTPDRVAGALTAILPTIYAIGYGVAACTNIWAARIRQINLVMAMATCAIAALWLTPAIHPESISTKSQIARYASGKVKAPDLALWEMANDWGRVGKAGLVQLRELEDPELAAFLERLDSAGSRYAFERDTTTETPAIDVLQTLHASLEVLPEGATIEVDALKGLHSAVLQKLAENCAKEGAKCVLILADLNPFESGDEGIILSRRPGNEATDFMRVLRDDGQLLSMGRLYADVHGSPLQRQADDIWAAIEAGALKIEPAGKQMITIGGVSIIP